MKHFVLISVAFLGVTTGCLSLPSVPQYDPDAGGSTSGDGSTSQNDGGDVTDSDGDVTVDGGVVDGADGEVTVDPSGTWQNVTANLANMGSECGNLSFLSAKPDEDILIAGVAQHGLWASTNGGQSWHMIGQGAGSDTITNRTSSIVYDPTNPARYWESGIYNAAGVYRTDDNGGTFKALGNLHHADLVSIDFSDSARKVLVAGGHEMPQTLRRSDDGGDTWVDIGAGLPDNAACTYPLVVSASTYLVGCHYGGEGIYRTTDGGQHWSAVSSTGGISAPLVATDGSYYWAVDNYAGLLRSTDSGATWTSMAGDGILNGAMTPVELPDGRLAMVGRKTIVVSADLGKSWKAVSAELPFEDISGFVYSTQQKAFFIKRFTCGSDDASSAVPSDAIMRFDFDVP